MGSKAVVVDDHPMCRAAAAMAINAVDPEIVVAEASSLAEALEQACDADLLTFDLGLPDSSGVIGLGTLRERFPAASVLVISGVTNPAIERQIERLGARGFLTKAAPISEMVQAIAAVSAGGRWFSNELANFGEDDDFSRLASLTPAQARVLAAMETGRLNKQIAHDLGLSEITVKAHVKAILKKLSTPNRTQAILMLRGTRA